MREPRVRLVMLAPSAEHPGGITRVVASWRAAGLGERVDLLEIATVRWDDPVPRKLAQGLTALAKLIATLARRRSRTVVHLHVSTGASLPRKLAASLIARAFGVPYIAQLHSGDYEAWVGRSRLARLGSRALFSRAAAAITVARRWAPLLEDLGAREVHVVPNGLPRGERLALTSVRDRRATAAPSVPTLLFYGRFSPLKGIDRVGAALSRGDHAGYEIRLFGNGDRLWLERAFAAVPGTVTIGPWIDLERKVAELARATVLLAPSRAEGFGQVLLDARAAGVAVIASDAGAAAEVLEGHAPLALVPADDDAALASVLTRVVDGEWPPPLAEPPPLPARFHAESAVASVVALAERLARDARPP